ncbi:MAG: ATP-binding protein [Smithellaceae bacterium]|nr:ATP-binding protein [Smithellaceae bacterium]
MLGIRQKMTLGFGGLLLIILIIGAQSIVRFNQLGQSIDVILRENYRSVIACQQMKEALERIDSGILFTFAGNDREGNDLVRVNRERFAQALQVELDNITVPGEGEKSTVLKDSWVRYEATLARVQDQSVSVAVRQGRYFRELFPLFRQVKATADAILTMNQDNMNLANDRARREAASARRQMYIFLLLGTLISLTFIFFIRKWILRPIDRLIASAEEIRSGNLELTVHTDSQDEIGRLSEAFNAMTAALRESRRVEREKLVRTEQATKEAFNSLPDAVAIVDPEGKVEVSTESARNVFGLKPGIRVQDLSYTPIKQLFYGIVQGDSPQDIERKKELFQRFVSGEERFFQPDAAPINDRRGDLTGVVLTLKDITEKRRVEEMKGGLVSTVSHQLKTPLTSVRMAIHLLLEEKVGPLNEKQAELLMAAREDSDLLEKILTSLMDMSRIESGGLSMACTPVSSRDLVREAAESFHRAAQDGGIDLEVRLADDLPPVCADTEQIGHLFTNLLSNAFRYTAPGGRITISAEAQEETVRFSVADTGTGIPSRFLNRVFEQFFRVPDQERGTGTGLGLAIAKDIVEAHGGTIHVESEEGKGTTFSFTLTKADGTTEEGR